MPTYKFEAMDTTGSEVKDSIDALNEEEAQQKIKQMGYFVTKITVKKQRKQATEKAKGGRKRSFAIGGVKSKLLTAFKKLLEAGHTLVVIEHNLDVLKTADYLIDLGPEGGEEGGRVVATGTPEQIARVAGSHTGAYLAPALANGRAHAYAGE